MLIDYKNIFTGQIQALHADQVLWVILCAIAVVLLIRAIWEPTTVVLSQISLRLDPGQYPDEIRPGAFRILLFSDLHAEHFRVSLEKLTKAMVKARPDIILFAGDLAKGSLHLPDALAVIQTVKALPGFASLPFLAVRGNHDSDEATRQLREVGVTVLENSVQPVRLGGLDWLFVGLDDMRTGSPDLAAALAKPEGIDSRPERRIIMAHNPDALLNLPARSAALFLGGHFHGGQIWMPFHLEFILLRSEKLPRAGLFKGHFTWNGIPAYISRGLGCVMLPLRLFSRPELTLIEISPYSDPKSGSTPE